MGSRNFVWRELRACLMESSLSPSMQVSEDPLVSRSSDRIELPNPSTKSKYRIEALNPATGEQARSHHPRKRCRKRPGIQRRRVNRLKHRSMAVNQARTSCYRSLVPKKRGPLCLRKPKQTSRLTSPLLIHKRIPWLTSTLPIHEPPLGSGVIANS